MIDTQANPKSYLRLMALVALLGIISAVVTFVFIVLVNGSIALIWERAALALGIDPRLFTLLVCTLGGLLVGLLVSYTPTANGDYLARIILRTCTTAPCYTGMRLLTQPAGGGGK